MYLGQNNGWGGEGVGFSKLNNCVCWVVVQGGRLLQRVWYVMLTLKTIDNVAARCNDL